jgi:hypothetical protein
VRRALAPAVAVAVAVLVAGCGSSRLTPTQLRTRATAFCIVAGRQTNRIATPASPAQGADFLRRGIAVLTPELAGLRTLKAPDELAQVYSSSIQAFSQKLDALKAAVHEMDSGANPVTAMTALQQRLSPIESAEDGAWRALEVPACVNR